jgi:hypothetical protein
MTQSPFNSPMRGNNMPKRKRPDSMLTDEDLDNACREFLKNKVPVSNIVFTDEFSKYLPLFNKQMNESMDKDELTLLGKDYFGRFSPQHNIYVLTHEPDENGMKHPSGPGLYKIDKVIPPTFRRVSSLNDVGKKVPVLITAFFNATTNPSGPFDNRKAMYAKQIADAIGLGDQKLGDINKDRSEFQRMEETLVGGKTPESSKQSEESKSAIQPSENLSIEW